MEVNLPHFKSRSKPLFISVVFLRLITSLPPNFNFKMTAVVHYTSLAVVVAACLVLTSDAFSAPAKQVLSLSRQTLPIQAAVATPLVSLLASKSDDSPSFQQVSEDDEGVPIPFLDRKENSFIECYADSIITVDDVEYTIGVPCDYCVALCYFEGENLVPVELDDELMNDIFPVAENIVSEEFEEELVLQRTPQTLTLVGELEDDEDDDDEDDDDEDYNGEEEVEVLLSFEHRDKEFNLVRMRYCWLERLIPNVRT
jgi:hypothetical protein